MANGGMFVLGNFYVSFCQGFQKEQGHWGQGRGTMKEGATQVVVKYVEIFSSLETLHYGFIKPNLKVLSLCTFVGLWRFYRGPKFQAHHTLINKSQKL